MPQKIKGEFKRVSMYNEVNVTLGDLREIVEAADELEMSDKAPVMTHTGRLRELLSVEESKAVR